MKNKKILFTIVLTCLILPLTNNIAMNNNINTKYKNFNNHNKENINYNINYNTYFINYNNNQNYNMYVNYNNLNNNQPIIDNNKFENIENKINKIYNEINKTKEKDLNLNKLRLQSKELSEIIENLNIYIELEKKNDYITELTQKAINLNTIITLIFMQKRIDEEKKNINELFKKYTEKDYKISIEKEKYFEKFKQKMYSFIEQYKNVCNIILNNQNIIIKNYGTKLYSKDIMGRTNYIDASINDMDNFLIKVLENRYKDCKKENQNTPINNLIYSSEKKFEELHNKLLNKTVFNGINDLENFIEELFNNISELIKITTNLKKYENSNNLVKNMIYKAIGLKRLIKSYIIYYKNVIIKVTINKVNKKTLDHPLEITTEEKINYIKYVMKNYPKFKNYANKELLNYRQNIEKEKLNDEKINPYANEIKKMYNSIIADHEKLDKKVKKFLEKCNNTDKILKNKIQMSKLIDHYKNIYHAENEINNFLDKFTNKNLYNLSIPLSNLKNILKNLEDYKEYNKTRVLNIKRKVENLEYLMNIRDCENIIKETIKQNIEKKQPINFNLLNTENIKKKISKIKEKVNIKEIHKKQKTQDKITNLINFETYKLIIRLKILKEKYKNKNKIDNTNN